MDRRGYDPRQQPQEYYPEQPQEYYPEQPQEYYPEQPQEYYPEDQSQGYYPEDQSQGYYLQEQSQGYYLQGQSQVYHQQGQSQVYHQQQPEEEYVPTQQLHELQHGFGYSTGYMDPYHTYSTQQETAPVQYGYDLQQQSLPVSQSEWYSPHGLTSEQHTSQSSSIYSQVLESPSAFRPYTPQGQAFQQSTRSSRNLSQQVSEPQVLDPPSAFRPYAPQEQEFQQSTRSSRYPSQQQGSAFTEPTQRNTSHGYTYSEQSTASQTGWRTQSSQASSQTSYAEPSQETTSQWQTQKSARYSHESTLRRQNTNRPSYQSTSEEQSSSKAETIERSTRVITNMFEIIFKEDFVTTAVHYDVKIFSIDNITKGKKSTSKENGQERSSLRELKNKALLRKIFEQWRIEKCPDRYPAYDGMANAFAARDFSFKDTYSGEVTLYDDEREKGRTFQINISKAGVVDLSWLKNMDPESLFEADANQTAVQVLDIILRHAPASRLISVGRSLFSPEEVRIKHLGGGLDVQIGGFMSASIGWRPYLNVDVAHKAFLAPKNVIDTICDIISINKEKLNPEVVNNNRERINRILYGVKVHYEIPGQPSSKRKYRVKELGPDAYSKFTIDSGKTYTIKDYFAKEKKYTLKYPRLPCLLIDKRNQQINLPAELCKILHGQAFNKKLDELQTAEMIKCTATKPQMRKDKINDAFSKLNVNESNVVKNEFHLEVSTKMKEVDARILLAPALQYQQRLVTVDGKGGWRVQKFFQPATLENNTWIIVCVECSIRSATIHEFQRQLQEEAHGLDMIIGQSYAYKNNVSLCVLKDIFSNVRRLKLVIVVIPNRADKTYGEVKQISELEIGVLTQCVKMKNVLALNRTTIRNILLKINTKLNGVNHTFNPSGLPFCLRDKRYMLVGADVSHPSPDARDIPSVAAVAASHDLTAFRYNVTIRLQQPRQEEIADLKEIFLKHIRFYVQEMRKVPERIIFYRDGVSEGQIAMVLEKEVRSIKNACRDFAREAPNFDPELTFVIVQKRHHVRIFSKYDDDCIDYRNSNVKPGMIVDTEITHLNQIDFYLVSHAGIQGTSKPTRYRCILNESNFDKDQLAELTYSLCHMYARCTKSVSYPAPTYNAHLAAYRGRTWIQGDRVRRDFQDEERRKLEPVLKSPMLFV